ncbi:MAG: PDZ domain-containing protein [Kiritimatiellia bacterium]|jgi:hypothetical protein|nr:PDZ domain-containing protein [Kiritimatiellia bacterium]
MKKMIVCWFVAAMVAAVGLAGAAEEAEKEAFLGVSTGPIGEALVSHLGLKDGLGLIVTHVAPGSPAAEALEKNDILLKVGDQKLVNHDQLATLIRAQGPGAEVNLEVMRGGKTQYKKVTLGEREARKWGRGRWKGAWDGSKWQHGEWPEFHISGPMVNWFNSTNVPGNLKGLNGEGVEELMKGIREKSKEWHKMSDEARKDIMDSVSNAVKEAHSSHSFRIKDILGRHGSKSVSSSASASISTTMIDDDGVTISISDNNESRQLTIKDKDGKTVFDGPITTDEQMEKIPEEYKDRIKELSDTVHIDVNVDLQ